MGIPSGKVRVHQVHKCKCGWCVSFLPSPWSDYRSINTLVVGQPRIDVPVFPWPFVGRESTRCPVQRTRSIWMGGVSSGFLSNRGTYNATKAVALRCLWQYWERGLTFAELRSYTDLTDGQLLGYLKRGRRPRSSLSRRSVRSSSHPIRWWLYTRLLLLLGFSGSGGQWTRSTTARSRLNLTVRGLQFRKQRVPKLTLRRVKRAVVINVWRVRGQE
jgi:hypothetical protein